MTEPSLVECPICCEKYNKSNHTKVDCLFCNHTTCRKCVQTYLLSTQLDPHCMNCKHGWQREWIVENCTKTFCNGALKDHRENILFEREKALLPATQDAALRVLKLEELHKERTELLIRLQKLKLKIADMDNKIVRASRDCETSTEEKTRRKFMHKCPVSDCRGFLTEQWNCQMCSRKICNKCNEPKTCNEGDQEHVCNPESVETMKLLKRDSKACPNCAEFIFKIDGCDQMFCTVCNTAFSWNLGIIETGRIHNPHYYEFMRKQNGGVVLREVGDVQCGNLPPFRIEIFRSDDLSYHKSPQILYLSTMHQSVSHILISEIPRLNGIIKPNNEDMRIRFLLNKIHENTLRFELQKREKANDKYRDYIQLFQMFTETASDIFRTINLDLPKIKVREQRIEFIDEKILLLKNLAIYFKEQSLAISSRYKCAEPYKILSTLLV